MREHISIRVNDHQELNGVKEFSVEISIPGTYHKMIIGNSQAVLIRDVSDSLARIFTLLGIPEVVIAPEPVDIQIPVSGFAARAKASFDAQVIRNGKVLTDEEAQAPAPATTDWTHRASIGDGHGLYGSGCVLDE